MVIANSINAANVQYGLIAATGAGYNNIAPSATAGVPIVSAGSSSYPIYGTVAVAGGGTGSATMSVNGLVITGTTSTSPLVGVTLDENQIVLGVGTTSTPIAATISAGTGMTITLDTGNLVFSSSASGVLPYVDVTTGTQTLAVNTVYGSNSATGVVFTLPATADLGDIIEIYGLQVSWAIAQNADQQISVGLASSTIGVTGTVSSTDASDAISLVCTVSGASTRWYARNFKANISVT